MLAPFFWIFLSAQRDQFLCRLGIALISTALSTLGLPVS